MTRTGTPEMLITADDPRFDNARRAWDLTVDQQPAAVALPRNAEELAAAVTHAAAELQVAVQGTGHGAAALGSLDASVLVKTSAMRRVTIAPAARLARVEAGARWATLSGQPPSTGWPRWPGPQPTSWPATRWVEG